MLEKRYLSETHSTLEVIVDQKPKYAGIDPYAKLIDRQSDDNLGVVENTELTPLPVDDSRESWACRKIASGKTLGG